MEISVELKLQLAKYSYNLLHTNDNNLSRAKNTIYRRDVHFTPTIERSLLLWHFSTSLNYQIQTRNALRGLLLHKPLNLSSAKKNQMRKNRR